MVGTKGMQQLRRLIKGDTSERVPSSIGQIHSCMALRMYFRKTSTKTKMNYNYE